MEGAQNEQYKKMEISLRMAKKQPGNQQKLGKKKQHGGEEGREMRVFRQEEEKGKRKRRRSRVFAKGRGGGEGRTDLAGVRRSNCSSAWDYRGLGGKWK